MAQTKKAKKNEKTSKWQWFILILLVPIIFAAIMAFFILTSLGVNVTKTVKEVTTSLPVVSSYFEEDSDEEDESIRARWEEEIASKDNEIAALELELQEQEDEILMLEESITELEAELVTVRDAEAQAKNKREELAATYEHMSAGKAADILSEMETEEIMSHLVDMNVESRAEILAKMEPEKAADVITLLNNE